MCRYISRRWHDCTGHHLFQLWPLSFSFPTSQIWRPNNISYQYEIFILQLLPLAVGIPLGIMNDHVSKRMVIITLELLLLKSCSMKPHVGYENETGNNFQWCQIQQNHGSEA